MMPRSSIGFGLLCALILVGCNFPSARTEVVSAPTVTEVSPPTDTPTPSLVPTEEPGGFDPGEVPEEAILILEPGPGSRLTSPITVRGIADPTFEQNLVIRVLLADGTELALQPTTIGADIGERGPFEAEVPVDVTGEENVLIQVYDQSARDGGIIHLASVGVTLAAEGPVDIKMVDPHPEDIHIIQPALGDVISGGMVHVEGFGLASFEGTLVIQVLNPEGMVIGSHPVIVDSPEMGIPGSFRAEVAYAAGEEGPGRIRVVDPIPVFDGVSHLSSVEITIGP